MTTYIYDNLWASCVKFCQDRILEIQAEGAADPQFIDFDTHATLTNLPDADLIGIRGFSLEMDDHVAHISVLFGIAAKTDDTNLFRHRAMVSRMFQALTPMKKFPCVDASSGAERGFLVAQNGTAVLPVTSANTRPLQFISVALLTDQTVVL